jgi:hypothetical protein
MHHKAISLELSEVSQLKPIEPAVGSVVGELILGLIPSGVHVPNLFLNSLELENGKADSQHQYF